MTRAWPVPTDGATVRIVPANESSWDDLQAVLGAADYAHHCQCQRQVWADRLWWSMPFEERALHLRRQTAAGEPDAPGTSGIVAYLGDEPVGWCEVGPRTRFRRVRNSPVAWRGRDEDKDDVTVWSAVCFVVRLGYRGRHLTYDLARGAAEHARSAGARALEGYPVVTERGRRGDVGRAQRGAPQRVPRGGVPAGEPPDDPARGGAARPLTGARVSGPG